MAPIPSNLLLAGFVLALALLLFGCICSRLILPPTSPNGPANGTVAPPINGTVAPPINGECATKDCFISAANECQNASLQFDEDYGTVEYSTSDCVFIKKISRLDDGEPAEMKSLLEGKSLSCKYEKGQFDAGLADSLIFGIENCDGPLADALAQLAVYASD